MTSGGPPAPYGQGHGGPPPPNESVGGTALPPGGWSGGYGPPPGPPRRTGRLVGVGVALAVVLSAAALIVALVRQPSGTVTSAPSPTTAAPASDSAAADKALCEKVGPLVRESLDSGRRFVALGDPGTPARDSAISAYRDHVEGWAKRAGDYRRPTATGALLVKNPSKFCRPEQAVRRQHPTGTGETNRRGGLGCRHHCPRRTLGNVPRIGRDVVALVRLSQAESPVRNEAACTSAAQSGTATSISSPLPRNMDLS